MALAASSIAGAAELPRLAGIIDLGDGHRLAVMEAAEGLQRIAAPGETIGAIQVVEVEDQWVRVRLPDGERTLRLDWAASDGFEPPPLPPPPAVGTRSITRDLVSELRRLASGVVTTETDLNVALQLPPEAHITAIEGHATGSVAQVAATLLVGVEKQVWPRISVNGTPGMSEVYLVPQHDGSNAE
jgi:hypothetical protein